MLRLDTKIHLNKDFIQAPNLTDRFGPEDLRRLADHVWNGYDRDKRSRKTWEDRSEAAMNLAMQVAKAKTFPWPNASNIIFPLVSIAALQFHSRAYTTLIEGRRVVKCQTFGEDPYGVKQARAERISRHMSYQVMEEDQAWEEQHDVALIHLPIVGSCFFKTRFDGSLGHNVSEFVMAKDLVIHYYARSVEAAVRKTHVIPLFRNEVYENVERGLFADILEEPWFTSTPTIRINQQQSASDQRQGQIPPLPDQDTPFTSLEQHCLLDLDGDGYAEPYIATIEETNKVLLRLTSAIDKEDHVERSAGKRILGIQKREYFTKYTFIPSPDGGIYDLGFGVLLGPINESVNALVNQLVDSGTISNTAGGFLGRGAKFRSGVYAMAPWEWKRVDATGDDLRKSIVPLEVREPSAVLFNLLSLLIDYANRIPGTTDPMVGESTGQNTPAETTRSMVEQGSKIYTNIFKRVWRSMKKEFSRLYVLNAIYLPESKSFGSGGMIQREDYLGSPGQVAPAADPHIVSESQRFQQAVAVKQAAMMTPGYNLMEVEKNYLRALGIEQIDLLYPGPDKVPPLPNPKVQVEQMRLQGQKMKIQAGLAQRMVELQEEKKTNRAQISKLEAETAQILAEVGETKAETLVTRFNAIVDILKAQDEAIDRQIESFMKTVESLDEQGNQPGGIPGMAGASGNRSLPASTGGPGNGAATAMV